VTEEVCGDALPEASLEVVVHSPEIQDVEPIRSAQCPRPPRLVVMDSNFLQMTLSTRRW
jgi:hypothetical protein